MIDIMNVEPHRVSRDLTGYSILIYGDPKTGKTTTASQFPQSLLLAFEKGYAALPGVLAQPIDTWAEMLKIVKQLDTKEAKEKYKNIIIDTADLAYEAAETHVCNLHGVDAIGDIGFGKGYNEAGGNFDKALRRISKMGYGVILISHSQDKTITNEQGQEFNRIQPTLGNTPRKIVLRFCDIVGYARIVDVPEVGEKTYLYMRAKTRFEAGSRFKYTPEFIEFNYQALVDAIADAIETQEQEQGGSVVDSTETVEVETKTWDETLEEFKTITSDLMKQNEVNKRKIEHIVEKNIGKGRKVGELSPENVDIVTLINEELQSLKQQ